MEKGEANSPHDKLLPVGEEVRVGDASALGGLSHIGTPARELEQLCHRSPTRVPSHQHHRLAQSLAADYGVRRSRV